MSQLAKYRGLPDHRIGAGGISVVAFWRLVSDPMCRAPRRRRHGPQRDSATAECHVLIYHITSAGV